MRQLVWFNRAGQELGPVGAPDAYSLPSLSPDEKSVAVTNANPSIGAPDIWRLDVLRGIASRFTFRPGVGRRANLVARRGVASYSRPGGMALGICIKRLPAAAVRKNSSSRQIEGKVSLALVLGWAVHCLRHLWCKRRRRRVGAAAVRRSPADPGRTNKVFRIWRAFFSQRTMAGLRFERIRETRSVCPAISVWCRDSCLHGWRNSADMASGWQRIVL